MIDDLELCTYIYYLNRTTREACIPDGNYGESQKNSLGHCSMITEEGSNSIRSKRFVGSDDACTPAHALLACPIHAALGYSSNSTCSFCYEYPAITSPWVSRLLATRMTRRRCNQLSCLVDAALIVAGA